MILEVHDLEVLWKITQTVNLKEGTFFGQGDYTGEQLFRYIFDKKAEDLITVYVSFNDKKINGFIILSVTESELTKKKQVFFNLCWIDPKAGFEVGNNLMKMAHKYAHSLGITELNAYSKRSSKAWSRRYGFKEEFTSYIMEVKNESFQEEEGKESRGSKTKASSR